MFVLCIHSFYILYYLNLWAGYSKTGSEQLAACQRHVGDPCYRVLVLLFIVNAVIIFHLRCS